jgi:hypothetical protein
MPYDSASKLDALSKRFAWQLIHKNLRSLRAYWSKAAQGAPVQFSMRGDNGLRQWIVPDRFLTRGASGHAPGQARALRHPVAVLAGMNQNLPHVLIKLTLHQHLLFELLAAQAPAPPQRLERFLVEGLQPAPFHLPLELLTPRCGVLPNAVLAQQAVHAHGAQHQPNHVRPPPASQTPKTANPPLPPLSGRLTRTNLRFDPRPDASMAIGQKA